MPDEAISLTVDRHGLMHWDSHKRPGDPPGDSSLETIFKYGKRIFHSHDVCRPIPYKTVISHSPSVSALSGLWSSDVLLLTLVPCAGIQL